MPPSSVSSRVFATSALSLGLLLAFSLPVPSPALAEPEAPGRDNAPPPPDIKNLEDVAYALASSRPALAAKTAASRLRQAPNDSRAHLLYLSAREDLHDEDVLQNFYRDMASKPDASDAIRAARLMLIANSFHSDRDCEEFNRILEAGFTAPDAFGLAATAVFTEHQDRQCRKSLNDDLKAFNIRPETPLWAQAQILGARLPVQPIDAGVEGKIGSLARTHPTGLLSLSTAFFRKARGSHLESTRRLLLREAARAMKSDKLIDVAGAHLVFRRARDPRQEEASTRLKALDPSWTEGARQDSKVTALRKASKRYSPEEALTALKEAAGGDLPTSGKARAVYEDLRGQALKRANRPKEALNAFGRAHEAEPTNPHLANQFAWEAALADDDLAGALDAINEGIEALLSTDWPKRSWERDPHPWRNRVAQQLSNSLDTKGWVLHGMERNEEAAKALLLALLLQEKGIFHAHLGLVQLARNELAAASTHLARGLALGTGDEALDALARRSLDAQASDGLLWLPDGLEPWLVAHREAANKYEGTTDIGPTPDTDNESEPQKESDEVTSHPLVGTRFPNLSFERRGKSEDIQSLGGPLVVDLWATWCGPCIRGLPHLEELAEAHENIPFLALSVDADPAEVEAFFGESVDERAFSVAWGGEEVMDEVGVRGIPAVFLLDEDQLIRAVVKGYREDDNRLSDAIKDLLDTDATKP